MIIMKIEGLENLERNLEKAHREIIKRTKARAIKAGKFVLRKSQEIVPVQTGNLKASGFVRDEGGKDSVDVVVGYTAQYALFVHENLEAAHGSAFNAKHQQEIAMAKGTKAGTVRGGMFERGPNQQAKFLERPLREQRALILKILAGKA